MAPRKTVKIHGAAIEAKMKSGKKTARATILQAAAAPSPEDGFRFQISANDWRAKSTISLEKSIVRGQLATMELGEGMDKEGNPRLKVVMNQILDTKGLKKFMESVVFKRGRWLETTPYGAKELDRLDRRKLTESGVKLREFDPFATGTDNLTGANAGGFPPNNEYVPIMGGPFNKQQYLFDYLDMHAKCFEAKNHNPLAKEIVDVITFFSMGKGVTLKFASPAMQTAWEKFEKRNKFQAFVRMDADTLTWAGEVMTQKTFWPDGYPRLRHIDPSGVWEIITDPADIDMVYYYHQQFPTQYQLVYKSSDISQEYIINDINAADVIHLKINTVPGEKRGRSDLFNILTWLKVFKDYYYARITKAQIEESFAIDVLIKGSDEDVQRFAQDPENNRIPRPGDKWLHNDAVEMKYMVPTASSAANATDSVGEAIRSICATGAGLSPEYLGVGGKSGNRATSITKSEPSARKFEDRQSIFKGYITDIAEWWQVVCPDLPTTQVRPASLGALKMAIRKRAWLAVIKEAAALMKPSGTITEPIDKSFQVIFPEIGTEDRSAKLKDIAQSEALQYLSHERAATMSATELGVTDYNYDEEQENIRDWRSERATDPLWSNEPDPAMELMGKGGLQAGPAKGADQAGNPAGGDAAYAASTQQAGQ